MLNHFFTLLLNVDDVGDPSEHIAGGFVSVTYPQDVALMLKLIIPATDREARIVQTMQIMRWIEAAGLSHELQKFDPRTDIDLWKIGADEYSVSTSGLKLSSWLASLNGAKSAALEVLRRTGSVDTSVLDEAWRTHFNPVYAAAALVISVISRADFIRKGA